MEAKNKSISIWNISYIENIEKWNKRSCITNKILLWTEWQNDFMGEFTFHYRGARRFVAILLLSYKLRWLTTKWNLFRNLFQSKLTVARMDNIQNVGPNEILNMNTYWLGYAMIHFKCILFALRKPGDSNEI